MYRGSVPAQYVAKENLVARRKNQKKGSRLVIIHFDTRRRTVSALSNCNRLCSEEGPQRGMVALPPSLDPVLKA